MILICGRMFCVFSFFFFFHFVLFLLIFSSYNPFGQISERAQSTQLLSTCHKTPGLSSEQKEKKKFPPPFGSFSFLSCKGNLEMFQKHQVLRID